MKSLVVAFLFEKLYSCRRNFSKFLELLFSKFFVSQCPKTWSPCKIWMSLRRPTGTLRVGAVVKYKMYLGSVVLKKFWHFRSQRNSVKSHFLLQIWPHKMPKIKQKIFCYDIYCLRKPTVQNFFSYKANVFFPYLRPENFKFHFFSCKQFGQLPESERKRSKSHCNNRALF